MGCSNETAALIVHVRATRTYVIYIFEEFKLQSVNIQRCMQII